MINNEFFCFFPEWIYYTVPHVQPSTLLHFTLTQTVAGEDADLYLQVIEYIIILLYFLFVNK
jgi:hypothetical protein